MQQGIWGAKTALLLPLWAFRICGSIWIVQCEAIFWGPQRAQAALPEYKMWQEVFGAKLILCQPPIVRMEAGKKVKADPDLYTLYLADDICSSKNIQLTQGGLFLFAILLGGDYADGLQGCGQKTAHALCQTSLGDELFTAVTIMGPTALDDFLVGWRTRLQSELINPTIPGASRHPALANKLPDDFPNPQILRLYALPVTSWSDIACIATFCDKFFHWESDIWLKHLRKNVWPGIIIHSLYRTTLGAFKSLSEDHKMNIKVPANILYDALPIMVEKFHEHKLQLPWPSPQHQTTMALNDATTTPTSNEVAEDITNAAHKTMTTREDVRNMVSAGEVIDLTMSNSDDGEKWSQADNTKINYKGYVAHAARFLDDMVLARRKRYSETGVCKDDIDTDLLAQAFDNPPNKYSVTALLNFLTQKCFVEQHGKSTGQGIQAAMVRMWDKMDGQKYAGDNYHFNESTGIVIGNPAHAPSVKEYVKCINTKSSTKGAAAVCHHADAIEELEKSTITAQKLMQMIKHGLARAFFTSGFTLWMRNFELCGLQAHDIEWDLQGPAPYNVPYFRVHLDGRKGWQSKQGWDGPLESNYYNIYAQPDSPDIDMELGSREHIQPTLYAMTVHNTDLCLLPLGDDVDSLQSYESGHSDALYPIPKEADKTFMEDHVLEKPITTTEFLGETMPESTPSQMPLPNPESNSNIMTLVVSPRSLEGSASSIGLAPPIPGVAIPDIGKGPGAWNKAVKQWEEGNPAQGLLPLREWPKEWYTGSQRTKTGAKHGHDDSAFLAEYPEANESVGKLLKILCKRGGRKERKSKNGTPEQRQHSVETPDADNADMDTDG
ncbi:hypothetical protein ARMGADRAFT_1022882 [Armillaria gallica]|uniref:XPG-I domain-containing protein n=1 Tax=Armillaria gallica TaxID=47427 RepID=A0A2H3EAJ8_ARMGA|nr:hypothetical protein ARMGADRAFT_1022882 [Armillaria gallica]